VSSKVFSAESERKYLRELDQESERRFRAELEQDPRDRKELHASVVTRDLAVGGSVPCGNELE